MQENGSAITKRSTLELSLMLAFILGHIYSEINTLQKELKIFYT